jgi:hypothetical protein
MPRWVKWHVHAKSGFEGAGIWHILLQNQTQTFWTMKICQCKNNTIINLFEKVGEVLTKADGNIINFVYCGQTDKIP